ncbi:amidohydrolase [Phycicoccus sp. M110.8]|uniref:amidohydrolase n=1 Tax=Phycicoccus sp. M110.8 TaxID=3075433 RepID=UPI0028FD5AB7|nr:amidohydrolase [Phycicoccus sp. M110.8]MDU0313102.1 amidohydrolase [Phycicoccus sp. M110.8]
MTDLVALRRALHARPELAFTEIETAAKVVTELTGRADSIQAGTAVCDLDCVTGLPDPDQLEASRRRALASGVPQELVRTLGEGATGVVVTVRGRRPGPTIGIRFDMDAIAVGESTSPAHAPTRGGFASTRPGIMHACGHDGHVAVGIELGRRLCADRDFAGRVLLVFQPGEEGVRGAQAMVAAGVVDDVSVMLGLHLGIDLPVGTVAAGTQGLLATQKLRVEFEGEAAHAALAPHQGRNALLGAASASLALHTLPPHGDHTTRVNVGRLVAGTAAGIVPERAVMDCELRADDETVLEWLRGRAGDIVRGAARSYGLAASVTQMGAATVARCDARLVQDLMTAASTLAAVQTSLASAPMRASDDMTLFMSHVQERGGVATFALVGASSPAPHHHPLFDIDERALPIAADWLERLIRAGL